MPRGGKRPNGGRPKGSKTKRTAAVKSQAVAEGIKPADVMQKAMEVHFEAKRYDQAAAIAKDLAPYVHPRLGAVVIKGDKDAPVQLQVTEVVVTSREQAEAVLARNAASGPVPG